MTAHTGIGMVAMAALQLAMGHEPLSAGASVHGHHGGSASLMTLLLGGALAYAAFSALLLARAHRPLDRAQVICMGVSVVLMAAASL